MTTHDVTPQEQPAGVECAELLASLAASVEERWHCTPMGDGEFLIASSQQYADGDFAELLLTADSSGMIAVSDLGTGAARLLAAGVNLKSEQVDAMFSAVARGRGIVVSPDHELLVEEPRERLGRAILTVSTALIEIDTLRLGQRAPREVAFAKQLGEYLRASTKLPVTLEPSVTGRSGKSYRVTASVGRRNGEDQTYVQAISAVAARGDSRPIDHVFRIWSDVDGHMPVRQKVSVLASPPREYDSSDLRLLEGVSVVGAWSERELLVAHFEAPQDDSASRRLYLAPPQLWDSSP